jgi:hypothetical protein
LTAELVSKDIDATRASHRPMKVRTVVREVLFLLLLHLKLEKGVNQVY